MNTLFDDKINHKSQEILSLIDTNDNVFKYHLDRFKYASRFNIEELETHRKASLEILISLNSRLKKYSEKGKPLFLVEAKETLADWAIWPFVRQFRIADIAKFDQRKEIKFLKSWLDYFLTHKKYPIVMKKTKPWNKENKSKIFMA